MRDQADRIKASTTKGYVPAYRQLKTAMAVQFPKTIKNGLRCDVVHNLPCDYPATIGSNPVVTRLLAAPEVPVADDPEAESGLSHTTLLMMNQQ
eukprot:m.344027 g.344027  ORF g.344027 m.344027 type:complete len:94 (+) comp16133_c0_seq13:1311-1592(+)